jgi:hypothetical protein
LTTLPALGAPVSQCSAGPPPIARTDPLTVITRQKEAGLYALGYQDTTISRMTVSEAHDVIGPREGPVVPTLPPPTEESTGAAPSTPNTEVAPTPRRGRVHPSSPTVIEAAVTALRSEIELRRNSGVDPLRREEARHFLEQQGLSAAEARRQISARAGFDWIEKMLDTPGNPKVLLPLISPAPVPLSPSDDVSGEVDAPGQQFSSWDTP